MIKTTGLPLPNPGSLPGGSLSNYVIKEGQFAGMTVQQAQEWARNYGNQVQDQFGQNPPKNEGTKQIAGYVGGLGAAAGANYLYNNGIGATATQVGNLFGGAGASSAGAAAASGLPPAAPSVIASSSLGSSGASAAGSAGTSTLGIGGASTLGTGAALGAGAATGYLQGSGLYNAAQGNDMNFAEETALALPTFGLSYAVDPIKKLFGSKREAERDARKEGRNKLSNAGLFQNNAYNLASGSGYDIAQPGNRNSYILDHNQDGIGEQVGGANALAYALLGGGKVKSDLTGEIVNAYRSDGNFDGNLRAASDKLGGRDAIYGGIANAWQKGAISANERDAGFAAIDKQYGIKNKSGGRWEDTAGLSEDEKKRNAEQLANREKELAENRKKHEESMAWYEKDGKKLRI
jgi:hypothetical protein